MWLTGPAFLMKQSKVAASGDKGSTFDLVNPDADAEVRPEVISLATQVSRDKLGSKRFQRFSTWTTLSKTVARLCHIAQCFSHSSKN